MRLFGILAAGAMLVVGGRPIHAEEGAYWPGPDEWTTRPAAELGFDSALLLEAFSYAGEHNSTGMIVVRKGYIAAEGYWKGWDKDRADRIFSSTKSIVATLVGMAIDDDVH